MDSFTFRSTIFEKRFEAFCDDVLSNKIFREIKGRNYLSRYKDAGFPFDAECDGQINSVRGGILFEFKSAGAQTPDQSARGGFIRDLCGGKKSKGKLVRSAELKPDAKHFVLVMREKHIVFIIGPPHDDPGAVWKQAEENLRDRASFTKGDLRKVYLAYVHPGYREAVYLALEAPRVNALLNSMISGLGKSAEVKNRRCAVAAALRFYVHLNRDGRDILKALVRDRATEVREWAADGLGWNFAGLDREGREILESLKKSLGPLP